MSFSNALVASLRAPVVEDPEEMSTSLRGCHRFPAFQCGRILLKSHFEVLAVGSSLLPWLA